MLTELIQNLFPGIPVACRWGLRVDGKNLHPRDIRLNGKNWEITYPQSWTEILTSETDETGALLVTRSIRYTGENTGELEELFVELSNVSLGGPPSEDFFYHVENARIDQKITIPVDFDRCNAFVGSEYDAQAGNRWADPGTVHKRIGRSPYQPFPAIALGNYTTHTLWIHGSLSQDVFYHSYELNHQNGKLDWKIFSSFKGLAARIVAPGEILKDQWYLGISPAHQFEEIFHSYTNTLRRVLPRRRRVANRRTLTWGSWNDGLFRNVSEESVLEEAHFLKQTFPQVDCIQIDDGYARLSGELELAHGLGMCVEEDGGIDRKKFPTGLKSTADKIRELGFHPGLWIGDLCPTAAPLFQKHPDWFLDYHYRIDVLQPLDVSLPEVREYMEYAFRKLLLENGYDCCKNDFWTYAFEDSTPLLRNHTRSGYELRRWYLSMLRSRLPEDGFIETGCDIGMGNPFLGEFVDNYRYGIDIGSGKWENVRACYHWGCACLATQCGDLIIPNSDAIGLLPGLADREAMFWINFVTISRTLVEIAGLLHRGTTNPRYRIVRKAACCINNGENVFFGDYDFRNRTNELPALLYIQTPYFSASSGLAGLPIRTVGLFNPGETARTVRFTLESLGLENGPWIIWDIWNQQQLEQQDNSCTLELAPRDSRLLTVTYGGQQIALLDADIEITESTHVGNDLIVKTAYTTTCTAVFLCDGKIRIKTFEPINNEIVITSES